MPGCVKFVKKIIKDEDFRQRMMASLSFVPDEAYLKLIYKLKAGRNLDLKNPQTFTDKQNWLKIHDIHREYTDYVDKIKVREIVKKKLGKDICFPLLGIYDKYEDINFDELPEKFVIKCNHDTHSVTIVKDKLKLDHNKLKSFYNYRLKFNIFPISREYPYRDVEPKILIEKYMVPDGEEDITDYKFFCFNGEPLLLEIITGRFHKKYMNFFDMNFNPLPIQSYGPKLNIDFEKTLNFEEMKNISKKLSEGIKFVRIDLYSVNEKVYFGEYTFFHGGGFSVLNPFKYELEYGKYINTDK